MFPIQICTISLSPVVPLSTLVPLSITSVPIIVMFCPTLTGDSTTLTSIMELCLVVLISMYSFGFN